MPLNRRRILQATTGALALPALSRIAAAETYPSRLVKLIVSVPAGGSPDVLARLLAPFLSEHLGQPFVIEDKPGASSNIATEFVARSAPDGYTLLVAISSNAINASLYQHLNYDFIRDTIPIVGIATIPMVMEVNPSVPVKTVPEFITYAKANPGKVNMAAPGYGAPLYVAGELFKMMTGVEMTDVPYTGEMTATPDLLSSRVQLMFGIISTSGNVKNGKLNALAVTSTERQASLPDVPAMAEFLPGYEALGWYGVVAPKGTPDDVVATLNKAINAALAEPSIHQRLVELGYKISGGSPADFKKFIADETAKWAKVVAFAGVKGD
ncbi:MAG TPA: tripartite tricarboxylate transporter substrate binding protein [Xanthobacteraceae bacterium]|jgi:tripartite-type tricarboxylate transporter receptor subunit TctC|nr:tripartite tricarboxylate transporter substrate binding protein [Xanthobacteraceae bacterium]